MSQPLHDYVCDRCSLRCSAGDYPGPLPIYNLGNGNVAPVQVRAAWCATCAAVTRAEALPSAEAVEREILEAIKDSREYAADDDPLMRQLAALKTRYVLSANAWRQWAVERRGTGERCLRCGSEVPTLDVLEGSAAWPDRFKHPGCGGTVSMVEGDLRVAWMYLDLETVEIGRDGRRLGVAGTSAGD